MKKILFNFCLLILPALVCVLPGRVCAQKKGQPLIDSILGGLRTQQEDSVKVKALAKLAETYLLINPVEGIGYAQDGVTLAGKLQWKRGVARMENVLGLLIGDTGNNTAARDHFQKSLALNKELGNSFSMISNLNNIGRSYQRESDYPRALDYFLQALAIAEQLKNPEQIALVGTNLTSAFLTQENYGKAEEYAEMTLRNGELSHTPNNTAKALFHLGIIKIQTRDTAAAKNYFTKALTLYQDMDNQSGIAQVLVSMATTEYPDYQRAIDEMERAQAILDQIGPSSLASVTNLTNLGMSYIDLATHGQPADKAADKTVDKAARLDKAQTILTRGLSIAREGSYAELESNISHSLSTIEEEKGQYRSALGSFKRFYSINDSLFSQDKKNELADLEGKHKIELKDKEIAIGNLELAKKQRTLIGLITGLILLGIIGGLLLRQNRLRQRSNRALVALNQQLDEANKVKLKFFGILSHDLRGPVSSLVNYLYLLRNAPDLLPEEEQAGHQQQIGQSAEELLETMETMLLWSKEQMDHFQPDIKMVPVAALFDHLRKFFGQPGKMEQPGQPGQIEQPGQMAAPGQVDQPGQMNLLGQLDQPRQMQIRFADPGSLEISADENYLRVITQNLTSNAIKALRGNLKGIIDWRAWREGQTVCLSITDNGPGIDPVQAKALFEEAGALNAPTGFGFHLIRDLARATGIKLSIRSAPGEGTTIVLSC